MEERLEIILMNIEGINLEFKAIKEYMTKTILQQLLMPWKWRATVSRETT